MPLTVLPSLAAILPSLSRVNRLGKDVVSNEGSTSGLFASAAEQSTGQGGDLRIATEKLSVRDEATVTGSPAEVVDVTGLIATGALASVRRGESKFIITGRGGLPPNPNEPLTGDNVLTEWNTLDSDAENRSTAEEGATDSTKERAPTQIVEANGWITNDLGEVILTATAPTATLDIPWVPKSDCNAPEPES